MPGLHVVEANPEEDAAALTELARWCIGYSPLVAPNPPDGVWIDIAGVTHLFGGEEKLIDDLVGRLARQGVAAMAAVADAPGCAWAVARYGKEKTVAPGRCVDAVASLPVQALRLPQATVDALHGLGSNASASSPPWRGPRWCAASARTRRFASTRRSAMPSNPSIPSCRGRSPAAGRLRGADRPAGGHPRHRRTPRPDLCRDLEKRGEGVRRLDLILQRVDHKSSALRVGTARASRDAQHLAGLFDERLQTVDPGFGIEAIVLVASRVEPLGKSSNPTARGAARRPRHEPPRRPPGARLGPKRVYRLAPVESAVPERSVRRVPAWRPRAADLAGQPARGRRASSIRRSASRRRRSCPTIRPPSSSGGRSATGSRRRTGRSGSPASGGSGRTRSSPVRDYYRVENEAGARFWLFRDAPADRGGRWWLHGVFG